MKKKANNSTSGIYRNRSKIKWLVLLFSALIGLGSILYTNYLVQELKAREKWLVELFAKTLEYTSKNSSMTNDVFFITHEIIVPNNDIPVILVNSEGHILDSKNIIANDSIAPEKKEEITYRALKDMKEGYAPIQIAFTTMDGGQDRQYVYYRNSDTLNRLTYYPYIQLSVISIFAVIAYIVFNYTRKVEQNRVWVGLAKETAHQLGTPISSLMAWVEYLKSIEELKEKGVVEELDKDIAKLQMITERFSNIGSAPVLKEENMVSLINNTVAYLRPRISQKVSITVETTEDCIVAKVNAPLFEWVIENLCKNAVDAMSGVGALRLKILRASDQHVFVDVSDTGKGIAKNKVKQVFNPGFTTKKRGWGLGLTLAQRIIDTYHRGKIFVKSSEEKQGTTFRIILRR